MNAQRQLDAPGTYFYYYSGSAGGADQTITLRGVSSGLRIILKNGQSLRLPADAKPETSWYIGNYANQATIVGTVIVGSGEIQDNRIQGAVEVINGGKNRSLSGSAFAQNAQLSPLAANLSIVQLWNPAGSGKNAILENVVSVSATATGFVHQFNAAAVTTLAASQGKPKLLNAVAAPVAQIRTVQQAGYPGTNIWFSSGPINNQNVWTPNEPLVIPPGVGYCVAPQNVNQDISVSLEWYEESAQ